MQDLDSYFATRMAPDPRRSALWKELMRYIKKFFRQGETTIELGSGYCDAINNVAAKNRVAIDVWEKSGDYAEEGVEFIKDNCWNIPERFFGNTGNVFASNLFEHLEETELDMTLENIGKALVSSGRLVLVQPNYRLCEKHYFDDPTHKLVFTDESLCERLEKSGFSIVHKEARFTPFSLKSRLPAHPLLVRLYLSLPLRPLAGQMLVVAERKS